MRRRISRLCCLIVIVVSAVGICTGFSRYCEITAISSSVSARGQIQNNLVSTLNLLEGISRESWMLPGNISYQEKAERLDRYNEIWGYQMIRAVDTSGGVYRADHAEAVSNLNSREYIQNLWVTNQPQITDVFLAGADGKTLNYTVAFAVAGNAKDNGVVFAAIYDSKVRAILADQPMHTALLGKKQQYMSDSNETRLGVTLESRLAGKTIIGERLESALLRVKNEEGGTIWFLDGIVPTCFSFQNVGLDSGWTVITSVSYVDVVGEVMPMVMVSVISMMASLAGFILLRKTDDNMAS